MMLNDFTQYLVDKRRNALWTIVLCTIIPMLKMIAPITMCLVTLHRGARAGFDCLAALLGTNLVLLWFATQAGPEQQVWLSLESLFYTTVCCYGAALLLRAYQSWFLTIEAVCYLGLFTVITVAVFQPNYIQYWIEAIKISMQLMSSLLGQNISNLNDAQITELAEQVGRIRALSYTLSILAYVFVARWLQTRLYQPGQLRQE